MIQREDPAQLLADVEQVLADPSLSRELRGFWTAVRDEALRARGSTPPVVEPAPDGAPDGFMQRRQQSVI